MSKDGPFHAEALVAAVHLDDAPVAGAVAAGHRSLPGKLRAGREPSDRVQHRFGAAGEHAVAFREHIGHERGLDDDLGIRDEGGRFGVAIRPEAEQRRRLAQRLGEIRQRSDPDPSADEDRSRDVEPEAVA
jgi:hypothetical protein